MTGKILTIAIPTYNRAGYLDLCLTRIMQEVSGLDQKYQGMVGVLVSNNASTDNSRAIADKHAGISAVQMIVVHQPVNIGGGSNFLYCYGAAKTPYIWLMGDDDVVLEGGLLTILKQLLSQEVDILYLNGYVYDQFYKERPKTRRATGLVQHQSALDFVRSAHMGLTFITASVVRSGVPIDPAAIVSSHYSFPHLVWIFKILGEGTSFWTLRDTVYAAKANNSGGYAAIEVFGEHLGSVAKSYFPFPSPIAPVFENAAIVLWFPSFVLTARSGDSRYLPEDIGGQLEQIFSGNWRYYIFLKPLIILPMCVAKVYFQLLRGMRRYGAALLV